MNILFNISFVAPYGDEMFINIIQNDGGIASYRMRTRNNSEWQYHLRMEPNSLPHLDYYYTVQRSRNLVRSEWTTQAHRLDLSQTGVQQYTVYDTWIDIPHDSYLYTAAFTQCINRRISKEVYRKTCSAVLRLKVRAPQMRGDERLILTGGHPALGDWHIEKGISCVEQAPNEWICDIDAEITAGETLEYKFIAVKDGNECQHPLWETGENRKIVVPMMHLREIMEYELPQAFFEICDVRKAGTLIPIFSLRTAGSFGVGDFGDLKRMIDWIADTGQQVLQILPINDTTVDHTWKDSYPYSCISIFALHPQYIDLRQLPALADAGKQKEFDELQKELNALPQIDYERVNNAKNEYLRLLFQQDGVRVMTTKDFKEFFAEEEHWLVPYAQYCALRDTYGTADFHKWRSHNLWNENERAVLSNNRTKAYKEVAYYYYVQYIAAKQMKEVHRYAREKHIILKGDIPIGVNRMGCDVWQEPRYFNLNGQAGAPPDAFSVNGQNWSFPTYNWDEMLNDGCRWWIRRFQNMQKYFDAYRIDHVLGFFRIWEIPHHSVHGLLGQFQPVLPLSVDEIENYGLHFRKKLFTRPYITESIIQNIFGPYADEVKEKYVEPSEDDMFMMRSDCDTQRKVEAIFKGKETDKDIHIRDGLYALISNVLFLCDHKNPEMYHPRIAVQMDYVYKDLLSDSDKDIFNRIYDDFYYRRNTLFWYREAMKKLPRLVEATRMLVCAEDLGMVPDCVPTVMTDLRILSLEIQSMPKEMGVPFGNPERYPYRSVCTLDSHDMPTLRMWWDEDEERAKQFYVQVLHRRDAVPHPLPTWLARDIMTRNLQSPSMLAILSLQDWLAISQELRLPDANAERINIPANPHHYWRYRMHLNIDDMLSNHRFCDDIKEMITQSGR